MLPEFFPAKKDRGVCVSEHACVCVRARARVCPCVSVRPWRDLIEWHVGRSYYLR